MKYIYEIRVNNPEEALLVALAEKDMNQAINVGLEMWHMVWKNKHARNQEAVDVIYPDIDRVAVKYRGVAYE